MNGKKTFSIKYKILVIIVGVVLLNIFLNILVINIFMNKYYVYLKQQSLNQAYTEIKKIYGDENKIEEVSSLIFKLEQSGVTVKIIDNANNYVYRSSQFGKMKLDMRMQVTDADLLDMLGSNESTMVTVKEQDDINLVLNLVGKISEDTIILSSPIRVINENSQIAETFMLISSTITFGIIAIIIYFFSKSVKKKVDEVRNITQNISNLNFNEKIYTNSNDEIGQFFENINSMSTKLESAIVELKSANEKLKYENEELEKVEKMRKQLITNISHEFKTPLTIISGYNQLLKGKFNDEKYNEYVDVISQETEKLTKLVIEFLELSKIENNSDNLNFENIDLSSVIIDFLESFNLEIQMKEITVKTDFDNDSYITSDINSIKKIVSNLITNAIKYVGNEKIINIKTYRENDKLVLSIFNTCDKIDELIIENIWNSFYKKTNVRSKDGTGLGLTIVKSIADNINADCYAQNIYNGVEFKIMFNTI